MSLDFQIAFPCPHLTIEERVALGSDRRSLLTRQPVTSGSFVVLTANDSVNVPPEGLFSSGRVVAATAGPFNIRKGRNTVILVNGRGQTSEVALPVGTRVPTNRVVELLSAAVRNAGLGILVVNRNGGLTISDFDDAGQSSRIQIRGDATESLGFTTQIAARGQQVYPPWVMGEREDLVNTVNINQFLQISTRFPQFTVPVRSNPVFKVTYATVQSRCRRCQTYAIENDYRFDQQGEALLIGNENLLNQALLKMLTTRRGSNPFHTFYGSILLDQIGKKALSGSAIAINEDVLRTIDTFKKLQTIQGQFQNITAKERLFRVLSVNVVPKEDDPTVFLINIVATNASGDPISITTVFAAPGTAALVGSNGLSLGLGGFGIDPDNSGEIF